MPTKITYSFTANVSGGPSFVAADKGKYDAYELVNVTIAADKSEIKVCLNAIER